VKLHLSHWHRTADDSSSSDAPVRLSQSVVNSLQNSPETDSTRAQDLELKKQIRTNEELSKVRDAQSKRLDSLTASLTTDPAKEEDNSASALPKRDPNSLAAHLSSPFYHDWSKQEKEEATIHPDSGRSHDSVSKEIMDLRAKLDSRKKVEKIPQEVEKAKESLVSCLRTNDRRPLDCWEEVQAFKVEVGKLEKAFIQKAGR
jgi:altered-inheritance-of-mitochondria protein 13